MGLGLFGNASVESYDCSHEQSGFIAVNPCTGDNITEEATVACRGTLSVRPDGVVVDAHYNTNVSSIWTDTGTLSNGSPGSPSTSPSLIGTGLSFTLTTPA